MGCRLSDDVWSPTATSAAPQTLPTTGQICSAVFDDVQKHFVGYLVSALGVTVVLMPLTLVSVAGMYAVMFAGMAPGIAANDEDLMVAGAFGGVGVGMVLLIGGMTLVLGPLLASLHRALWRRLNEGTDLTFGAAFSTIGENVVSVVVVNLLVGGLTAVGAMMCYLPGLILGFALSMAVPLVAIHGMGPLDAIAASIRHTRDHLMWYLPIWGVTVLLYFGLSNVPFIGTIAFPICGMIQLHALRAAFPNGAALGAA